MNYQRNPERTGVILGSVITAAAGLIFIVVLLADVLALQIDMMNGGYALMFVALFIILCGVVTTIVFGWRAALRRRILDGADRLASWTYPAARYEQQQEKVYLQEKSEKRGLFIVTSVLIVVIGGLIFIPGYIFGDLESLDVFVYYLGIIPLLAFFAFVLPWLNHRSRHNRPMEAIIARDGLMVFGDLHPLKGILQFLENVELKEGKTPELLFNIRYLSRVGWFSYPVYTVSVPVPPGEMETAHQVVAQFMQV